MIDKSLRPTNQLPKLEPIRFDKGGVAPGETSFVDTSTKDNLGHDMVLVTFDNGEKVFTNKAVAEAMIPGNNFASRDDFNKAFVDFTTNEQNMPAWHDKQVAYDKELQKDPDIQKNRAAMQNYAASLNKGEAVEMPDLIDPFQDTSPFTVKDDDGREVTITSGADSFMDFTAFNNSLLNSAPSTNNDVLSSAVDTAFPMDKDASGMPDTRGPNVFGNRPPATNEGIGSIFGTNVPIDPRIPIDFKDENFEIPILTPFKLPELPRTYGPDPRQNRGTDTPVPFYRPPVMSPKNEFTDKMFVDTLQTAPQQRNNYTNPFRRPT